MHILVDEKPHFYQRSQVEPHDYFLDFLSYQGYLIPIIPSQVLHTLSSALLCILATFEMIKSF
jgi:hypothetical protein